MKFKEILEDRIMLHAKMNAKELADRFLKRANGDAVLAFKLFKVYFNANNKRNEKKPFREKLSTSQMQKIFVGVREILAPINPHIKDIPYNKNTHIRHEEDIDNPNPETQQIKQKLSKINDINVTETRTNSGVLGFVYFTYKSNPILMYLYKNFSDMNKWIVKFKNESERRSNSNFYFSVNDSDSEFEVKIKNMLSANMIGK